MSFFIMKVFLENLDIEMSVKKVSGEYHCSSASLPRGSPLTNKIVWI